MPSHLLARLAPALTALAALALVACGDDAADDSDDAPVTLVITLTNITSPGDLQDAGGGAHDIMLAPGIWALHGDGATLFDANQAASTALEALAEEGTNTPMLEALSARNDIDASGGFAMIANNDTYDANPIAPGDVVSFQITATPGQRLALATMYAQSNDIFLALPPEGLALFDADGQPLVGDHSAQVTLWDSGTELNEEPGTGPNQAPRQAQAGQGDPEDGLVTTFTGTDAQGFSYPAPAAMLRLDIALAQ